MHSFLAAFFVSAVVAACLTPLVRWVALRFATVLEPGPRDVHTRPIPRFGGVAIALATCAPLLALFFVDAGVAAAVRLQARLCAGIMGGGLLLGSVGLIDDLRGLRAAHKLALQVLAATLAFAAGLRIESVFLPLFGTLPMGIFALPVTVLWVVGITNAVNLIDGLDGLAGGVVFFASVTGFTVAFLAGNILVGVLMAALAGALLGFLFYNFNPARIFMGDSGSYFLGFVLATSALTGPAQKTSAAVSLLVPILALGLPIFDTLFSMLRRILERRPIFSPDRGHLHHRLLDMGLTHRRAVLTLYGVSIVLTVAALAVALGRSWAIGLALVGASVVMLGLVRFVGYFEYLHLLRRQKARFFERHVETLRHLLPQLWAQLAEARTEDDVWQSLETLLGGAGFCGVEARALATERAARPARLLVEDTGSGRRDALSASYPIGADAAARGALYFAWRGERETVSPEMNLLLQLVTDAAATALTRHASDLAPARVEPRIAEPRVAEPARDSDAPSAASRLAACPAELPAGPR